MRVVVPYTETRWLEWIELIVRDDGYEPELAHMRTDHSYWDLMRDLWHAGETFTVVEHDVLPWPGAISEMESCPLSWCGFPYHMGAVGITTAAGCTKFGAALLEAVPDALERVRDQVGFHTSMDDSKHWYTMDNRLWAAVGSALPDHPLTHRHEPPVLHMHAERWDPDFR